MHRRLYARASVCATALLCLAVLTCDVRGQRVPATGAGLVRDSESLSSGGTVPLEQGFNVSMLTTSQHDSTAGWSSVLRPNIAWRFDPHFSFNAGLPIYDYIVTSKARAGAPAGPLTPANTVYTTHNHSVGDLTLAGQYETEFPQMDYALTVTVGLPSGDSNNALGAGVATYDFNNHFEREIDGWLVPDIEVGIGNNSALTTPLLRRSFLDVGTSAYFQTGVGVYLPFSLSFSADAYEDLPFGNQTITSTTVRGKKGKQATQKTTSTGSGEDNGFTTMLEIPVNPHTMLSGFYNRSLRNHTDTAGFSVLFFLKRVPRSRQSIE